MIRAVWFNIEKLRKISVSFETICAFWITYFADIKLLSTITLSRVIVPADSWNVRRAIAPVNVNIVIIATYVLRHKLIKNVYTSAHSNLCFVKVVLLIDIIFNIL